MNIIKPMLAKIETSEAVFVFWTPNVANNQDTKDVVNWGNFGCVSNEDPVNPFTFLRKKAFVFQ